MRNAQTKEQEKRSPVGTFKKQQRITIVLAVLIVLLAVCAAVAYYFVRLNETSFEHNGVRYRVIEQDGAYVLVNGEGITCDKAYGGEYYMTDDGEMLIYVDSENGDYSVYAAVEGLEYNANDKNSENAYYESTQTVLVFPAISESNMQAIEMHNEHGSFAFYRNESGDFDLLGMEEYLASYDAELFSSFLFCTGTMIAQNKIVDPIADENGEYSEYGLADSDNYWTITTIDNRVYKVIAGDKTPSGDGYYIQYVECTDPVLDQNGLVESMTETPRMAVYITSSETVNTSAEYVEKPFRDPAEALMIPQIVYEVSLSSYFDVQNYVLLKNDEPFVAFDYIDIAERSISQLATTPFVMLLDEHRGFTANSNNITNALDSFYAMTFVGCTKLNPTEEELFEYGIFTDPILAFTEKNAEGKSVHYLVLRQEDGTYALCDGDKNPLTANADGTYTTGAGAVLRVNAETGEGETVSGEGSWDHNYSSPYSIYYSFDVTVDGVEGTTEQLAFFSEVNAHNTIYAYSPHYGMIVEIPSYELEFLRWSFFEWIESDLFDVNIAYAASIKVETPEGLLHDFTLNNTESKQGKVEKLEEKKFYLVDNGSFVYYTEETYNQNSIPSSATTYDYQLKKVDGVYGVYNKKGVEYPVTLEAYFRVSDTEEAETDLYVSHFGMPSGGKGEGWFRGKVYLMPDKGYILCDAESGYWGFATINVSSSDLIVIRNNDKAVDTDAFRDYYEVLVYASIEQEHVLSDEEEAALIGNPANFQLRLSVETAEQDLVFEFYYLTSRKSYLRVSGDGGETFMGDMYILTSRVDKLINDADKVISGEEIDSTAKS